MNVFRSRLLIAVVWCFSIAGALSVMGSPVPAMSAITQEAPSDSIPMVEPTESPVFQRMEDSVDLHCPEAKDKFADTQVMHDIPSWSAYVHALIRCGEKQHGVTQAQIYGLAISQILGSILFLKPDADEASAWRDTAKHLIQTALPEAKTDEELVNKLNAWLDELP